MNIYFHELKALRKSTVIWTCTFIGISLIFLSLYPSMASDAEDYKAVLGAYPESIRAMLGINLDYITSFLGFYSMIFSFIILCAAIQAMNWGTSIISKESRERTADFLLVKPVSRSKIMSAKILAAFTMLIITDVVFYSFILILANNIKISNFDGKLFFMINLTLFFIQLIFLALGLCVSVFFKKLKSVLPISLGVVFSFYMIGALIATESDSDIARFISPFKYFDLTYIIKNAGYETSYLAASAIIILISIILSYVIYIKKDIHSVS